MDYYEELGISRTATEEEIRRAHRRLTKLLHPDQQTDDAVKQLAETQMRRVNSIVEVLCDPQRRKEYDQGFRDGVPLFQAARPKRGTFHSWPWWVGSTVGAVVLTVGAVWFWADKWGSSFGDHSPTYIASGAETGPEPNRAAAAAQAPPQAAPQPQVTSHSTQTPAEKIPASASEPPEATPVPSRTIATVPAPEVENRSDIRNAHAAQAKEPVQRSNPTVTIAEVPRRRTLNLHLSEVSARPSASRTELPAAPALSTSGLPRIEAASMPPASLPAAPRPPEPVAPTNVSNTAPGSNTAPAAAKASDPLIGEWVYAPSEPEKRKAGFYPPEFIDLKIWNQGGLRGEYRARYHVTDKPIPPDVTFALAPDGNSRHFTWESGNGSRGTLKVNSMDASSIRIEWKTTVFSRGPALTAGTATLVRRTP